ncbi:DNA replication complex GINS protein PSF1-like [Condylostylus longicornis]|uniref:DNA replication complex GINS protein PSF1-like n=1 Tax=Condylostylus longicornis TaxID=2530218 RepID=UPI00244E40C2|nr:DNA replication complex GINS protein PSF1-like [Condylostylus longicornis]
MLGEKGLNLIKTLKRSSDTIPEFDDEGVRKVLEEIKILYEENCEQAANYSTSGDRNIWPLLNFRHAALQRNKRCLLVYLNERLEKIKSLRWEFGPVIPSDIKSSLCEPEIMYFNNYSKSLANYMRSIGDGFGIDLTSDLKPPKTLYVEVRCLKDYGKFEMENGDVVFLKKNSQHYLPRSEIEPLIRQGVLKHLS